MLLWVDHVSAKEECFEVQFSFVLYDKVKIFDYSDKIAEMMKKNQQYKLSDIILQTIFTKE